MCFSENKIAGPLWTSQLFEKEFVKSMLEKTSHLQVDKKCGKILEKCVQESEMPGLFFTLDEIASKGKSAPISLNKAIERLKENGFIASPTSLNNTGFRTNAKINQILEIFYN